MDWKKIVLKLMQGGKTQAEVGRALGRPQSWVSAVANGHITSLRWEDGQKLLALLAEVEQLAA
jgi:predicted XRE-type DNA-binding protein